jgi:hypothetical protein
MLTLLISQIILSVEIEILIVIDFSTSIIIPRPCAIVTFYVRTYPFVSYCIVLFLFKHSSFFKLSAITPDLHDSRT